LFRSFSSGAVDLELQHKCRARHAESESARTNRSKIRTAGSKTRRLRTHCRTALKPGQVTRLVDLLQAERFECLIDMFEVDIERAKSIDLLGGKFGADFRFGFHVFGKTALAFPSFHRRALHRFISCFALRSGAGEREQDRLAEIKSLRDFKVLSHSLGINLQPLD